ncbi:MAG: hypothetical protein AB7P12_18795 [Alphaproteobacteria bacterium]
MKTTLTSLVCLFCLCLTISPSLAQSTPDGEGQESIGAATMLGDGTIYADVFLVSPDGEAVGERRVIIQPSNPAYEAFRAHVGWLNPGESRQIPPNPPDVWTEE